MASLSIPWGFTKGDTDRGGYHLVWVRDLAQVTGGLLRGGRGTKRSASIAFSFCYAGTGRELAAKHVVERTPLLVRRTDGSKCVPDFAHGDWIAEKLI